MTEGQNNGQNTPSNQGSEGGAPAAKSYSEEEFNKQVERARRFEGKLTDVEKQLERFKGVDLDALIAKATERDELVKSKAGKGDQKEIDRLIEEAKAAVRKEFDSQIRERDEKLTSLSSKLKETQVVDRVFTGHSSKFVPQALDDFKRVVRDLCDLDEEGNIFVKGEDGKPRFSNIDGRRDQRMSPDELIAELEKNKPHWFAPKGTPGGKQPGNMYNPTPSPSSSPNGKITPEMYMKMTPEQQASLTDAQKGDLARIALFGR